MILPDGFVVGGRYTVDGLLATGSRVRVYAATSLDGGAGRVVVKTARHDDATDPASLRPGREALERSWRVMTRLYEAASSAVPLPVELVRMYPGDPRVREIALGDRDAVRNEPYLVTEFVAGTPVSSVIASGELDEERALMLGLRTLLLVRASLGAGVEPLEIDPGALVVDAAGENVTLVDVSRFRPLDGIDQLDDSGLGALHVPVGIGRLLVGLLAGMKAPDWPTDELHRERWERLLHGRRVPREYHDVVLGCLGYRDRFDATLDAATNRLRGLVRAPRAVVYPHPGRTRDLDWPIAAGELIGDRFEVTGTLAQGGRGFIYRVHDPRAEAEVLIKANKYVYDAGSEFALELPSRRLELEHEYDVMTRFASRTGMLPQPVGLVYDMGRGSWFDLAPEAAAGEPYLAMEWIKGVPLLELLHSPFEGMEGASDPSNRLRPAFVVRLVAQIAELMRVFHGDGFLLQDLKPENILYDPASENVYLVDLAGVCPRLPTGELQRDSVAFGTQTHGFAAPEFAERWERCDDRFDIYSLGATAFHLLTGVNPERLALERGQEYPELPLYLLRGLPAPVGQLVARCVAPLGERLASADAVREAAERARLLLSRARPLDVRDAQVTYTEAGVRVGWRLPPDPRLSRVRVTRVTASHAEVIYDAEPVDGVDDPVEVTETRGYRIETALTRRGDAIHSRGTAVRAEACPPPVAFEVAPDFGGNRVHVALTPHADGVEIRHAADGPPATTDDGEALDIDAHAAFHACEPGVARFYAAFSRYGERRSAPRFASAVALAPLLEPGALRVRQDEAAIEISWAAAIDGAFVQGQVDGGETVELAAEPGASVVVWDAPRGASLRLGLRVRRDGVTSRELAQTTARRWPERPVIDVAEAPGGVVVSAREALPQFARVELRDAAGRELAAGPSLPLAAEVPAGHTARLHLRCLVEHDGPTVTFETCPPGRFESPLEVVGAVLPCRLRWRLPAEATAWTGDGYEVHLERDGQPLAHRTGSIAELAPDGQIAWTDDTPTPGATCAWTAHLRAPSGALLATSAATARVLERLPVPVVTAALARVEVAAAFGVAQADLRVRRSGVPTVALDGVALPAVVELEPGEQVRLCWRRTTDGGGMPWSDEVEIASLARPDAPRDLVVDEGAAGVVLRWSPVEGDGVTYRVVAPGEPERLVYDGASCEARDMAPEPAEVYALYAVRSGLSSPRVHLRRSGPVHRPPAVRAAPPSPSSTRIVQYVQAGPHAFLELAGPAAARRVLVLRADQAEPPAPGLGGAWWSAPGAVMAALSDRARVVVPVPSGPAVSVWVAEGASGPARWRPARGASRPVPGVLVGAVQPGPEQLMFREAHGSVVAGALRLVAWDRAGRARSMPLDGAEWVDTAGGSGKALMASVGSRLAGAASIGLSSTQDAVLLVPLVALDDVADAPVRAHGDVATGWAWHVALRIAAELGAPLASLASGTPTVAHLMVDGAHVELQVDVERMRARGRARARVAVRSDLGAIEEVAAIDLTDVAAAWGDVPSDLADRVAACLREARSVA